MTRIFQFFCHFFHFFGLTCNLGEFGRVWAKTGDLRTSLPRRRHRGHSHGRPRRQERECKGAERTRGRRRHRGQRDQFSACRSQRQLRTRRPPTSTSASYTRAPLAQAGAATRAPLHKHGAQGQRPTAPKSQRESRRARRLLRQRRHRPSIKPHHRATPPQPTRTVNPHHDRRSPPKKREFLMTASQAKTTKRPPCRCLFCATQHPWAAASTATSMQAAPQDADCAKKRNKTPLS